MHKNVKKRLLIFLYCAIVVVSAIFLFFRLAKQNINFFKTPTEVLNEVNSQASTKKSIRLGGIVLDGSLKIINNQSTFILKDDLNQIKVIYNKRLPDLFKQNQYAIALGNYDLNKKIFYAKQVIAKHDEYYRPKK